MSADTGLRELLMNLHRVMGRELRSGGESLSSCPILTLGRGHGSTSDAAVVVEELYLRPAGIG